MADYALGIDLGTTYTAAAVARDGRAEICALGNRAATIPTVVHFGEDGTFKVGEAALPHAITSPGRVAREVKRRLGDPTPLVLGGSAWSADALLGEVLRFVVDAVTGREGSPAAQLALTHPASWGPYKLDLLTQAVRHAGLRVHRYLSEPEAAAFAYASSAADRLPRGSRIAVYDLGGGTFDATVLRTTADGFEILGNPEGIERLGGIDIDETVFAHVRAALGDRLDGMDTADPRTLSLLARLRADCIAAKEQLSSDTEVSVPVTLPGVQTEVRLSRAELEAAIRGPLEQTVQALHRALASAGTEPADLHAVLLVGGSSRIPLVADLVGQAVGRPVAVDAHPKHGVAIGAALAAHGTATAASAERRAAAVTRTLPSAPPPAAGPPPTAPPAPAVRAPSPAPTAAPDAGSPAGAGKTRTVPVLLAAVAGLAVVAALLAGVLLGRGGGTAITPASAQAVAPTGTVPCPPSADPAVCISRVQVVDGELVVDFAPQRASLAAPVDGGFPPDTVHPLFFLDTDGPAEGREWGPKSPFTGDGALSRGYRADEVPAGARLCVLLVDDQRRWQPGTGNCVALQL